MRLSCLLASLIIASVPAQAATLTPEKGQVLVNKGNGYQLATRPLEVAPGHVVVANPGGAARVTFPDGCDVKVLPGSVFTVAPQSPCQRVGSHVETHGTLKDSPVKESPVEVTDERQPLVPIILGGTAVGLGAVLLLQDKDKPASP
jgi:hypothetical protein